MLKTPNKLDLICNEIAALDTILQALATRQWNPSLRPDMIGEIIKTTIQEIILPSLSSIQQKAQKMENGLEGRKKVMIDNGSEHKYQTAKMQIKKLK